MNSSPEAPDTAGPPISPQSWRRILTPYTQPDRKRAAIQLLTTALPLLACAGVMLWGLAEGVWPLLALALPAAFFVVRAFMIQHDCGHGSFFRSTWTNNALGSVLGVLTLMPYGAWRRDHAVHHATSGNLARRGVGDVTTLTVAEYRARSGFQRLLYRLYRHPAVLFGLGPAYVLLVRYRVPYARRLGDRGAWLSILGTDVSAAAAAVVLAIFVGPIALLVGWGTVMLLATAIGVWFFYVQHQFEDTYWRQAADWDFHAAAVEGSSFYDLPNLLHWLTASIGFHHIHHLASKIPNYRLRACFKENPELRRAKRLTIWASLKSVRLTLWDEERRKLVSFREVERAAGTA
ncbi:MAG TPA: fatty acid desaturase [Stellaceae bacterium]|nr:fatty acid desaturase [Stellaceae bacterium]